MSKKHPKKWTEVYPVGTPEGDEETRFFRALERHPKYSWRSTAALAKESGLSLKRVEEIINKYYKKGMVFQSPKNEEMWGYWERVPEMLPKEKKSINKLDQDQRISKNVKSETRYTLNLSNDQKGYVQDHIKELESYIKCMVESNLIGWSWFSPASQASQDWIVKKK